MMSQRGATTVIFVRHGHTHNPRRVIYGRLPRVRLSPAGREAAERTARYLADRPLAALYTSPLLRARQTAALLAARHPGLRVRRCAWLAEVDTVWAGQSLKLYDEVKEFSFYSPKDGRDGETIEQVFARMDRALRMILFRHPGQTTLCVSHGDPIKIVQLGYAGTALTLEAVRAPDPPEASLVIMRFSPGGPPAIETVDPAALSG